MRGASESRFTEAGSGRRLVTRETGRSKETTRREETKDATATRAKWQKQADRPLNPQPSTKTVKGTTAGKGRGENRVYSKEGTLLEGACRAKRPDVASEKENQHLGERGQ